MRNPIIARHNLPLFPLFQKRPVANGNTRLVFQTADGTLCAPQQTYTSSELSVRRAHCYYEVSMGTYPDKFESLLPAHAKNLKFPTTARYEWTVSDPVEIVKRGTTDVPRLCQERLQAMMHEISEQFEPLEFGAARKAILARFTNMESTMVDGVRVTGLNVNIEIPTELQQTATDLDTQSIRAHLERQQQFDHGALQELKQSIELALDVKRREHYGEVVKGGSQAAMANVLSQDPGAGPEILDKMLEKEREDKADTFKIMKLMTESRHLKSGDLTPLIEWLVDRAKDQLGQFPEITGDSPKQISAHGMDDPDRPSGDDREDEQQ